MKFLLFIMISVCLFSQDNEKEYVKKSIITMFDAMRENDSTKLRSVLAKDIISYTIYKNKKSKVIRSKGNMEQFIKAVGKKKEKIWDEKISSWDIKVDGALASAWTAYKFYLGGKFSHCGVNSFQLSKESGKWKIIYIIDTRRRKNCNE